MRSKRVVITGIGAQTAFGTSQESWKNILDGKSAVGSIKAFDTEKFPCKIASVISNFNPEDYITARDIKKMDRFIHLGIAAADMAIEDANWKPDDEISQERTGVMIGSGIGGLAAIENSSIKLNNSNDGKVSPYFIPSSLINLVSGHVSIKHGFSGPNSSVSTACTTGAHAIGDATRIIKYGDADVVIAGGTEAPITPTGIAGFSALRALTTKFNDSPKEASRPWDTDHSGFVMGEGAAVIVLEEYEHALRRGAKMYAEIVGYGLTGDASHITSPSGKGALRAMQNALKDAQINSNQINYINAHGTSTPVGDRVELNTVQSLFDNKSIKMSSTKSSIGHLLGAAGSLEVIFTALAICDQVAPPTINLHNPIDGTKINLVPIDAQPTKIDYAMSNSFAFGGTNASLILHKI